MRILLDTNVLASAAATRGLCADVVRTVLAEHELVVSGQILQELQRVLRNKFGVSPALIEDFVSLLQQDTILADPKDVPKVRLKDEDDLGILAAAVSAGAEVIVTGDKELLKVGHIQKTRILSPRQFWETLSVH
jgi:putative PIN family toxin of toxin-antitoxin system